MAKKFNINKPIEAGKILLTMNHSMFKGSWDNRISLDEEPDTKEYKRLKASLIETNGNIIPIIINSKNEIIEGHHRLVACAAAKVPVRYMVQDDFTLDNAIKLSETTSKWTNDEKVKRGVKHEVPICKLVDFISESMPVFSHNYSVTLLRVCEYLRWAYPKSNIPSHQTILRKLATKEGIAEIKKIEITDDMRDELIAYHVLVSSISYPTVAFYNADTDVEFSSVKASDKRLHQAVLANYPQIVYAMPEFKDEWVKICKRKKYRGNKEIYTLITSHNLTMMNEGFRKLLSKKNFLKR